MRNLYDKSFIIDYEELDNSLERIVNPITDDVEDLNYIVVEDDTLENIAAYFLGSSRLWFEIADKNNLDDIFNLEIGSTLIIPISKKETSNVR